MTEIDFAILSASHQDSREQFAAKLAIKRFNQGIHVHLHCDNEPQAKALSDLLWQSTGDRFIPHAFNDPELAQNSLISIGFKQEACCKHREALINMAAERAPFFSEFKKLTEIVTDNESPLTIKQREHAKFYRARHYPIKFHKLP